MDKRNGLRYAFRIAVGITLIILLFAGGANAATTQTVCDVGCNFTGIQAAVNAANSGDTIEVQSGTYYENVDVNKQLILRGMDKGGGNPEVDAGGGGNAITLSASFSTLEGFTAVNASAGIYAGENSNNNKINNNTAHSSGIGFYLSRSEYNVLSDNNASNNGEGIHIEFSSENLLTDNYVSNNYNGIIVYCEDYEKGWFGHCSSNKFVNNTVWDNNIGFYLPESYYAGVSGQYPLSENYIFINNTASNNSYGFLFNYAYNFTFIGNKALHNTNIGIYLETSCYGSLCYTGGRNIVEGKNTLSYNNASYNGNGIYLRSMENMLTGNNVSNNINSGIYLNTIQYVDYGHPGNPYAGWGSNNLSNNTISNNGNGIYVEYSTGNTFTDNSILTNNNGIFQNNSGNNVIYNNYFSNINNTNDTGNNIWNTTKTSGTNIIGGPYLGGNVWANPGGTGFSQTCTDVDIDGICDSTHMLDSNNTDYLPLAYNIMPPAGVTNLINDSYGMNYINWTWTDPSEPDFHHVEVYLNNVFETNVSSGAQSYTAINLIPGTQYTIGTKTVDTAGNVNATLVTAIATTAADTTAPVITLLGRSPVTIEVGSVYTDAGATALDTYNGDLTGSIVTVNPVINTTVGTYTVTYNLNDSSSNPAVQVTRIVNVVDTTAPVWNPVPSEQIVQVGSGFSYDVNGDDQTQVNYSINDTVNFAIDQVTGLITNITALNVGTYGLNITATDTSSNSVSQIITVTVQAEPTYSVSGYVFDNKNARLAGVSVQNGSKQATTTGSGNYSIAGLMNGSYNFSYTKSGFDTGYLEVMVNGANVANANKTIFDNKPIFITITSPKNNSVNNTGFINVTVSLDRTGTALINWDGSNESMIGDGTHFYKNKTGLLSGNYSFRVYANDSNGVFNASETRIVTVNRTIINNTIGNFINISTFIVNTTLEIASPGGNTTLIIPNGTNASVSGSPVTWISIDSVAKINSTFAALAGNDKFIGENVTFGPPGAVFDPPIQIRFNYTDAQIAAAGITASQLRVKFYNTTTNIWVEQTPYILNETGKYITANVSHFSAFVLLGTTTTTTHSNPPYSSGGGGGGGGGGPSGENFTNIIVKEKYDLQIYKDIITSYKFKNTSNPILSINIVGNINAGEIGTAVEVLRNTSSLVKTPAPGNVYQNVNVWVGTSGFGTSKNIKQAVITFRIENSWISSNNMKSSGIKMVRWDGSIWEQLETSEKTKDSAYSYFEAKTNSFSSFAITGIEKKEYITENADIIEPTKPAAKIQSEDKNIDYLTNWFLLIGVFFAIGLIIEMYVRMKKK